jgi:hypothetical protein
VAVSGALAPARNTCSDELRHLPTYQPRMVDDDECGAVGRGNTSSAALCCGPEGREFDYPMGSLLVL